MDVENPQDLSCLFCDLAASRSNSRNPEDEILVNSPSFYVKPGLGHFVDGYFLINSRVHHRSLSYLSSRELAELENLVSVMKGRLGQLLSLKLICFEHGEVNPSHHPGCCFEHAHLHLVPLPEHVNDDLLLDYASNEIESLLDLQAYAAEHCSYLYYETRAGRKLVYRIDENLPSQFLRQEFCRRLGMPDEWDWAVFPYRERITDFVERYKTLALTEKWPITIETGAHRSLNPSSARKGR